MGRRRILPLAAAAALVLTAVGVWGAGAGFGGALADGGRTVVSSSVQLLRVKGGAVSTVVVDNTAALNAAVKSAQSGDVIKLAPGVYDGLSFKGVAFDTNVTITSADPSRLAVITDFRLVGVSGLTFQNLEFATASSVETHGGSHWAFTFIRASNINIDNVHVHGSLDGDSSNDVQGISLRHASNITVTNSEFEQLERALTMGSTDHIRVQGNYIHDLRSDGFNFAQVSFVEVRGNVFANFRPGERDHPDAIQFWTSGTKEVSHDILVTGNAILRGDGDYTQGIFFRDQTKEMPFERVTISDNLLVNTGYNAIRVNGVKDLTLSNNTLVSAAGENKTWLRVSSADGVVAEGNRGSLMDFDDNVKNLVREGNTVTKAVSDRGAAAIQGWLESNPDIAGRVNDHAPRGRPIDFDGSDDETPSDPNLVDVDYDDFDDVPWTEIDVEIDPSTLFASFDYAIL